ncbi:MAG: chemotaxis response regulator protein-glutamate methylesterase [Myxococcota bacterium]
MRTRVLIVDDSTSTRKVIRRQLEGAAGRSAGLEVVGEASDPFEARERIFKLRPDILTLDVEMPRMNGLEFLKRLMQHHPLPVVVLSSVTPAQSKLAIMALELGACEVLCKGPETFAAQGRTIVDALARSRGARMGVMTQAAAPAASRGPLTASGSAQRDLVVIGSSTGGPQALDQVIGKLPKNFPPTALVQHMPAEFTGPFARRLNERSQLEVFEARDRMPLRPGQCAVAPGGKHLELGGRPGAFTLRLSDAPAVNYHKPSVDVLFRSVIPHAARTVGVILTGMGSDGAEGLLALKQAGAHTIGQDQATSLVYGMPRVAAERGAVQEVRSLPTVAQSMVRACFGKRRATYLTGS